MPSSRGLFLTQGLNPHFLQADSLLLSHLGSPRRGLSHPLY